MSSVAFWDKRFADEGKIWGEDPSRTIDRALEVFRSAEAKTVLVPGCGYGRNACALASEGLSVTGLDVSTAALSMARQSNPAVQWIEGSVLDPAAVQGKFDAIYTLNLLHLFFAPQRQQLIDNCRQWLRPGGTIFAAVFADTDFTYGRGQQVEPGTFESRPGRPAHYFSESDMRNHFPAFDALESGVIEQPENHEPDGPHVHQLRYLVGRTGD